MQVVLQRVRRAAVTVDGEVTGAIELGLMALIGVGHASTDDDARWLAAKTEALRVFADDEGRMNRSVADVGGGVLAISQFTLYGDASKGRRPSFIDAAAPELGEQLYERFADSVASHGVRVARGKFGAEMEVELVNDGPMTIWLDSAVR